MVFSAMLLSLRAVLNDSTIIVNLNSENILLYYGRTTFPNSYYEKFADGKVVCIDDEIPFEIPRGWEWCRLGNLVDFSKNKSVKACNIVPNSWLLDLEDIEKDSGKLLQKKRMVTITSISDKHKFEKGNVLYSKLRPYLNKVIIADEEGYCTSEIVCFDFGMIYSKYAQLFLMSPFFVEYAMSDAYGVKMPRLGSKQGNNGLIPIPPIEEQRRIVNFISSLDPFIEKFSKAHASLDKINKKLKETLRKSTLQEAIRGNLVSQNYENEPASVLLQRIKEEKQRLVKEGKLKKKDVVASFIYKGDDNKYYEQIGEKSICIDNEVPFEIPESWQWCRIGTICIITNGFTPLRTEEKFWLNGDINWFTIDDIRTQGEYINFTKQKITKEATTPKRVVREGSILLCCTASVGQCAFTKIPITTNQQFNALTIKDDFCPLILDEYLFVFAKTLKDELHRLSGKTTFEFVSVKKISNLLIPIPPLNEQARIITCVKQALSSIMSR